MTPNPSSARLPVVVGLGELLWDVFPDGKRPGGAPANVAFQAQQLGCSGRLATRIGSDADGDELLAFLTRKGLETSAVQRDERHPTGRVTVSFTPQGQPTYIIHERAAWDYIEYDERLREVMEAASAVCFGTLAQRSEASRQAIQQAVGRTGAKCLRVYDVNLRQSYYAREWVEASLKLANVVKLNDEEVETLSPLLGLSADPVEFARQVIEKWGPPSAVGSELPLGSFPPRRGRQHGADAPREPHEGPRMVCITRGAKGCLVIDADGVHDIPGRPVKVADTVGAGDAFTAGLIVSQLEGWPVEKSADFANRVGALVASRQGAMPELREEFAQLRGATIQE